MKAELGQLQARSAPWLGLQGPGHVSLQLHHVTMVAITARLERARFCSEQTLHH